MLYYLQVVQITFKELQVVLNSSFTLTAIAQSTSIKFDFSSTNPNGFTANLPALSTALLPINKSKCYRRKQLLKVP